jgi:hypothetical protein
MGELHRFAAKEYNCASVRVLVIVIASSHKHKIMPEGAMASVTFAMRSFGTAQLQKPGFNSLSSP